MKQERKISVLVAEDHTIVRRGLVSLLSLHSQIEVIGEAENGRNAIELVKAKEPDVVLMDIGMPELNGVEATRQIKKSSPATKVLVLSGYDNDDYIREIMECGANGYLLKSTAPEELIIAILAVSKGQTFLSPSLSGISLDRNNGNGSVEKGRRLSSPLTAREREILQLIAEGNSHAQIAGRLNISIRTVDTHRNNILKKLHLHDAAGLVAYAIKNGIVILPK